MIPMKEPTDASDEDYILYMRSRISSAVRKIEKRTGERIRAVTVNHAPDEGKGMPGSGDVWSVDLVYADELENV
jgi:hypothetical protein